MPSLGIVTGNIGATSNGYVVIVGALNGLDSEEHTSELQSHHDLVCRLLLEKKKKNNYTIHYPP